MESSSILDYDRATEVWPRVVHAVKRKIVQYRKATKDFTEVKFSYGNFRDDPSEYGTAYELKNYYGDYEDWSQYGD